MKAPPCLLLLPLALTGCAWYRQPDPLGGGNPQIHKSQLTPDLLQTTNLTAAQQALQDAGKPVPAPTECDPQDADGNPGDDICPAEPSTGASQ